MTKETKSDRVRVRRALLRQLVVVAALVAGPATHAADILVVDLPSEYELNAADWVSDEERANSPFFRQRFDDRYADALRAGNVAGVAGDLVGRFGELDWGEEESARRKIELQLRRFLGALERAITAPGIDGPLDQVGEQSLFLETLNASGFGIGTLRMETIGDAKGYFKGTSEQLLLFEWENEEDKYRLLLRPEQVRQWRLLEDALTNLVNDQVRDVSAKNIADIRRAVERWENYLDNGYSMMPWESLVNGWWIGVPEGQLGPPERQWILLHPTLGVEFGTDPLDESRVKESLHVEMLGHIWYRGDLLDEYAGLSLTVSLREDLDPGAGLLVHIKRDWNLGVVWHDVDEDPFLFLSFDLFDFAKEKVPEYQREYDRLKAAVGELEFGL